MLFYVNLWNAVTKAWLGGVLLNRDTPERAGYDAGNIASGYFCTDMEVELSVRGAEAGFSFPASVLERLLTVEDLDRVELSQERPPSERERRIELPPITLRSASGQVH